MKNNGILQEGFKREARAPRTPEQHRQQLFRCSRLILQLFCSLLLKGAAVAFIFEWNAWKEVREKIIMIILKKSRSNLSAAGVFGWGHTLHTVGRGHPDHQSLLGTGVIRDKSS